MKLHHACTLAVLATALFAGCSNVPSDPNVTYASKWVGGLGLMGGNVNLEARRIDEHKYEIIASGAALCTEKQVIQAWIWMADKIAAGRPYTKETKTEMYAYDAPAPMGPTHHAGKRVLGHILIE